MNRLEENILWRKRMGKNDILEGLSWIVNMANDWLVHNSPSKLLNKRQQLLHEKEEIIRNLIEQMPREEIYKLIHKDDFPIEIPPPDDDWEIINFCLNCGKKLGK